ncbi:MAG TPA: hypothetical protein PKZ12_08225, partial [Smithellaceae bacterium]|nr:hypothetical protein [Smithellaceae bacterium]
SVREALVEYVDLLFQLDQIAEAKKWIAVAEQENIAPANVAFLQGMILSRERKYKEAITALEKAKTLDPSMAQTVDYQIGLCYVNDKQLKKAQERFKATASFDPNSDLAAYARQYMDAVEQRIFYTRPLRFTLGLYGGYDSNLISKSRHQSLSGGIDEAGSTVLSPSLRVEYVPNLEGPWLLNVMYSAAANINERFVHSRDSFVNTFSVMPGYNFGRFSLSLLGSYSGYTMRTDSDIFPDGNAGYKHYMDYFTGGPVGKVMLTDNQILELFVGYDKKNYYNQVITSNAGVRDAEGYRAYIGWTWFYLNSGFLNLRYDYGRDAANGIYWDSTSHRFSANLIAPLVTDEIRQKIGFVYLQLGASWTENKYSYVQPYQDIDGSGKLDYRTDRILGLTAAINWEISRNWKIIFQYSHTNSCSSIPVYEYNRNIYMTGVEFMF